ncbi:unnamed protein product [Calicophoron daubneyi]
MQNKTKRRLSYMIQFGSLKKEFLPQVALLPPDHGRPSFRRYCSVPVGSTHLDTIPESKCGPMTALQSAKETSATSAPVPHSASPKKTPFTSVFSSEGSSPQSLILPGDTGQHSSKFSERVASIAPKIRTRIGCTPVEYWPYFTYLICTTHVLVFVVAWAIYGPSPVGQSLQSRYLGLVRLPNLRNSTACWAEPENLWLGPRYADLIRLGACYPPCMRFDSNLYQAVVEKQKTSDRLSGCCLQENGQKCYQTSMSHCVRDGGEWLRYRGRPSAYLAKSMAAHRDSSPSDDRLYSGHSFAHRSEASSTNRSGPVCGLDPAYCLQPRSSSVMPWSETDVTEWPVCSYSTKISETGNEARHMQCEVTGRPCCLGIRGECIITTQEHCKFVHGIYNANAALCSQVNCLRQVCGMWSFWNGVYPDQHYRVTTALFIPSGFVPLIAYLAIHLTFVRNLEKLIGSCRMCIVYLLSGSVGNLLSGYFLPYQISAGPTPSLMALVGLRSIIYFCYSGPLPRLNMGLVKNVFLVIGLFIAGFFPWLDNFLLFGGFVSGALFSFVLLPYPRLCTSITSDPDEGDKDASNMIALLPMSSHTRGIYARRHSRLESSMPRKRLLSYPRHRLPVEVVSSVLWLVLIVGLFCLFNFAPVSRCKWCTYFTCLPIVPNLCDAFNLDVNERSECATQDW